MPRVLWVRSLGRADRLVPGDQEVRHGVQPLRRGGQVERLADLRLADAAELASEPYAGQPLQQLRQRGGGNNVELAVRLRHARRDVLGFQPLGELPHQPLVNIGEHLSRRPPLVRVHRETAFSRQARVPYEPEERERPGRRSRKVGTVGTSPPRRRCLLNLSAH